MKYLLAVISLFSFISIATAEVQFKTVTYSDGDQQLKGYLAWDDSIKGKRPGVLVIHEWWGLNDYAKKRAGMLAEEGYVAFAADMYGPGKVTSHADDAKGWMMQITANVDSWQKRAQLGLDQLKASELVDSSKLAAIGYCFGGATVMQLAYSGADIDGVVSFHGSLPPATPEQAGKIKSSVLIAHGDADPFIPAERVTAFKKALSDANVDWEMDIYNGARHGFTNPGAGDFGMEALAYNEKADQRSWNRMKAFFNEIFSD
jgi:dienelactone hydrolase